ncbi:GH25 family lysozyme [Staphylospora marina]|uniref:GH25 family lysozyme n=1 Tax=Staphylospora marina TaxID=2490858 RepID=UPI000F5BB6CE|nr:GH25 family lysozyme [Staphylospora marina]
MKKWLWFLGGSALLPLLGWLNWNGYIWHNELFAMPYEVRGLDVSHYQGRIDWERVGKDEDIRFVFIKATEGKTLVDRRFRENWSGAKAQGLKVGAYHFFTTKSTGLEQAENFIRTVPKEPDSLPPVIDVEIHLGHDRNNIRNELETLRSSLEKHYGKAPVFYVTYDTWRTYISRDFGEHPVWIRDIYTHPDLDGKEWLFWQYANRGHVDGIDTWVDLNAFRGSLEDFETMFP